MSSELPSLEPSPPMEPQEQEEFRFFDPPLWCQRRNKTLQILEAEQATSVIDFGCGEGAILHTFGLLHGIDHPITRVAGIDISLQDLEKAIEISEPRESEFNLELRPTELAIEVYFGSVDVADRRLLGYDALACMEVIEHLDPPVLAKWPQVVLGTYRPKVVIVSTPNAEFNVYFPQLKYNTPESTFRHDDHRFEWTRQEFQDWANTAANLFSYSVEFTGVGSTNASIAANTGFCSQIAIFRLLRPDPKSSPKVFEEYGEYHLLKRIEYPYYDIIHTWTELLDMLHTQVADLLFCLVEASRSKPQDQHFQESQFQEEKVSQDMLSGDYYDRDRLFSSESDLRERQELETLQDKDQWVLVSMNPISIEELWARHKVQRFCKRRSKVRELILASTLLQYVENSDGFKVLHPDYFVELARQELNRLRLEEMRLEQERQKRLRAVTWETVGADSASDEDEKHEGMSREQSQLDKLAETSEFDDSLTAASTDDHEPTSAQNHVSVTWDHATSSPPWTFPCSASLTNMDRGDW